MNPFKNFGIAKRLYAVSFLLIGALCALAVSAWIQLSAVESLAERVGQARTGQLMRIADVELNVTRVSLQIRHAMLVRTPADLATTLADIADKRKHIDQAFAEFESQLFTAQGREIFAKFEPLRRDFWAAGEANIKAIEAGQKDEAFALLVNRTIPLRNLLLGALDAEKKRQASGLTEDLSEIQRDALATRNQLIGLIVAIGTGLLIFSWYIARVLQRRVSESRAIAEQVREGNLSIVIEDRSQDEFSPLLLALDGMQSSLVTVVSTVRSNADSVALASAEIAQGNNDLSARTEQQASALEETAASMEQLNSTVKQTAENAAQANQLAVSASAVAARGGDVVAEVVSTMKGINESSKKIADITGVIDGIAFQTNILALNAAVEAARAGEQGRGFAVVASEVRSLAQRSAQAAKEIKTLIQASVERIDQGTVLADRAGTTMTEVVGAIRRVTDLMGEISAASTEQSLGVAQVGEAVTQMDQATQQNAALVEESAAAANSLQQQAQDLVQAVAVFKLAGNTSGGTGSSRSHASGPVARTQRPLAASARPGNGSRAIVSVASPLRVGNKVNAQSSDADWASF